MCDNCKVIFSENAEGWSNMTGNRMERDKDSGRMINKSLSVDYCPECVEIQLTNADQRRAYVNDKQLTTAVNPED